MPPASSHHLPPWAPLHHKWYQGRLPLPDRYVLSLYHHLIVCFAKRITGFDWFFVEKSHFPHPLSGGTWCCHVLSCSYDCNDRCLSLPRALFIALLFSRSFHNKNGHVCGYFSMRKVTLQFCCCFWYHAIIRVPSFLVMMPTMKCMTCFLPAAYTFVSCSFILSLCRWITLSLAARY
jgi:hypothetical protein